MIFKSSDRLFNCILALCLLYPCLSWGQGKCPKATELSATTTEKSAKLTWSGGSEVTDYQVDVKHGQGTSSFSYSSSTSELTTTVEDLQPGSNYRFRVKTKCDKGSGGSSQWFEFTTAGDAGTDEEEGEEETSSKGPCPKATNLAILEITDSTATLGWLGNAENVSYLVDVHQKEHTPTYKLSETVDTTILSIEGLVAGGNYKFRVKSKCEKNSGGSSSWINFTTTGGDTSFQQCPKATNLSVRDATDTSALLKWIARDSFELFTLEVKSFGQTSSYSFDTTLVEDSLLIDGLEPGGDYHFRVVVTCSDGSTSGSSDWSKFRTLSQEEVSNEEEVTDEEEAMVEEEEEGPDGDDGLDEISEPDTSAALKEIEITTFPNPAQEKFTLELPTEELGYFTSIILSDMSGRVVFEKKFDNVPTEKMLPIPVHSLQEGIYKLVIRSIDFHKTKTIVVHHR